MACLLPELFASLPEIEDLYAEVVGGPPRWILVDYDHEANVRQTLRSTTTRTVDSTYGQFLDPSGKVPIESLTGAGWPLAEVRRLQNSRL